MKAILPTRCLALFLAIGFTDLVATAVLHARGLIVERNPLMAVLLERSDWLFVAVKLLSLLIGWAAMSWYAKINRDFVRKVSLYGSAAYVGIWIVWFIN